MVIKLLVIIAKFLNRLLPYHISLMLREKHFNEHSLITSYEVYDEKDASWAILMQGPVIKLNNFTFETLKLYKHIYPGIQLILSTWKGEDTEELNKIKMLGIDVIENIKPSYAGIVNINFQIASTSAGILRAKENKALYVLKTRTDIRLVKDIDFLHFLNVRAEQFPEVLSKKLVKRLVTVNINMFQSRLYTISDLTMFGQIDDMLLYWNVPFDVERISNSYSFEEFYKAGLGEFYFVNNFLMAVGFVPENSPKGYATVLKSYFAIADIEEIDMFWYKYRYYMEGRSRYNNLDTFSVSNITWNYGKWITLFKNNNV